MIIRVVDIWGQRDVQGEESERYGGLSYVP